MASPAHPEPPSSLNDAPAPNGAPSPNGAPAPNGAPSPNGAPAPNDAPPPDDGPAPARTAAGGTTDHTPVDSPGEVPRRPHRRFRLRPVAAAPPAPHRPGETLAHAREVTVRLGGAEVVHGVDLPVRAGEILALVGPNGAGKSTLLSALAADTAPDTGEVWVHGRPRRGWRPRELALRRAVLPQNSQVSFPFTVAEVVAMGRAPWAGLAGEQEDGAAVAEAMSATEVAEFAGRPFSALSGGERARVALARVLAQRTPLLFLDEPTAALDLRHQELVMRVCRERAAAGDAVVVVLHDLALAAAHADRVAVLNGGRLVGDGPPVAVLTAELVSTVYRQPVRVLRPPEAGGPLIVPVRPAR